VPVRIDPFFHEPSFTVSYLVSDPGSGTGAVIDPVLDFDAKAARTSSRAADAILAFAAEAGIRIAWVLETHPHADHLTAAQHIKRATGAAVAIGGGVAQVQAFFDKIFDGTNDGGENCGFDRLLGDGERLPLGALEIEVMHTPGHTPACVTYRIEDAAFVGDTLFMPDYGTARTDFPGGDARQLYRSIRRILALPPETRLFMCHDYKAPGRDRFAWETTVAAQRAGNVHIRDGVSEEDFVRMRTARDAKLDMPALILPAIQVNIRAGRLPPPEANGIRYLKLPLDCF